MSVVLIVITGVDATFNGEYRITGVPTTTTFTYAKTATNVTSTAAALSISSSPVVSSGNIGVNFSGNSGQYVAGDGSLVNFPTVVTQAQNIINDGSPKKPSVPAEGGNLLATLIDVKRSYLKLEVEDQTILRMRYHEGLTLQQVAGLLECAVSTADRRCTSALRKVQNGLGGDNPWQ